MVSCNSEKTAATILVVDDDAASTDTFTRFLRLGGYRARGAMTAELGLTELKTCPADAIILDLRMPLLDGLGFLRRLRSRGDRTPVTIVTGDYFISDDTRAELRALGAEIRFKPLWLEELAGVVDAMLAGPSTADRLR